MDGDCCGMEQLERSIQRSRPGGDSVGTWEEEAGTCEGDDGGVAEGGDAVAVMSAAAEPEPAK